MLKKYCTTCGRPTEYSSKSPVFCSSCGVTFGGKTAKAKSRTKKADAEHEEDEDQYSDDDSFSTDIKSLDFSVQKFDNPVSTLASLAALGEQESTPIESPKNSPIEVDKEGFLRDFQKEAGSLRG